MSQGNLVFKTPRFDIPDEYDPEFMRDTMDLIRGITEEMANWAEISDKVTRAQFIVGDFTEATSYTLDSTSTDIGEIRDFLLGLTVALQRKGIVRSVPQET